MPLTIKNSELEAHVAAKAQAEGISADEYLERLVAEDKQQFEELRADVQAGFASIDEGDFTEYREDNLGEFFNEIEAEGLKRLSDRQAARK